MNCTPRISAQRASVNASRARRAAWMVPRSARISIRASAAPLPPLDASFEEVHSFAPFANWVVPGAVMQGQYPYRCPKLTRTYEEGEEKLQYILEGGVSTFVSMNGELSPQTKMQMGGEQGFYPYKATAELIQSALNGPPPQELVEGKGLRNPQLNSFLPQKKNHALQDQYSPKKVSFVHSAIEDGGVPQADRLSQLVADLSARIDRGEVLYVHCHGGKGRSGVVTAALLAVKYGVSADEALERVRRAFDTRTGEASAVDAGDKQAAFVREFVQSTLGRA